jgi:hypothetical protein
MVLAVVLAGHTRDDLVREEQLRRVDDHVTTAGPKDAE